MAQNVFISNVREPIHNAVLNAVVNRYLEHLLPIRTAVDEDIRMSAGIAGEHYRASYPCDVHEGYAALSI